MDGARHMPPVKAIATYWEEHATEQQLDLCFERGPFCFGCNWLPPFDDTHAKGWDRASAWLDRAHLIDRVSGGPDDVTNLVLLCHLCHIDMPPHKDREEALNWVALRKDCGPLWQVWTDKLLWNRRNPQRNTTMVRLRREFLEFVVETARAYEEFPEDAADWLSFCLDKFYETGAMSWSIASDVPARGV